MRTVNERATSFQLQWNRQRFPNKIFSLEIEKKWNYVSIGKVYYYYFWLRNEYRNLFETFMRTFPGSYTYILFCIIRFVTRHILRFNINSTRYIGPNYVLLWAIVYKIRITDKIEIVYCIFHKRPSINDDIHLGGGGICQKVTLVHKSI